MVGPTEQCGRLHNVLTLKPASSGLWDGFYLGLIPNIEWGRFSGEVELGCVELVA